MNAEPRLAFPQTQIRARIPSMADLYPTPAGPPQPGVSAQSDTGNSNLLQALIPIITTILGAAKGNALLGAAAGTSFATGVQQRKEADEKKRIEAEDRATKKAEKERELGTQEIRGRATLAGEENEAERLRQAEGRRTSTEARQAETDKRAGATQESSLKKTAREGVEATGVESPLLSGPENKAAKETFSLGRRKTNADIARAEKKTPPKVWSPSQLKSAHDLLDKEEVRVKDEIEASPIPIDPKTKLAFVDNRRDTTEAQKRKLSKIEIQRSQLRRFTAKTMANLPEAGMEEEGETPQLGGAPPETPEGPEIPDGGLGGLPALQHGLTDSEMARFKMLKKKAQEQGGNLEGPDYTEFNSLRTKYLEAK